MKAALSTLYEVVDNRQQTTDEKKRPERAGRQARTASSTVETSKAKRGKERRATEPGEQEERRMRVTVTWAHNTPYPVSPCILADWHLPPLSSQGPKSRNSWWRLLCQARWARRKGRSDPQSVMQPTQVSVLVRQARQATFPSGHAQRQW